MDKRFPWKQYANQINPYYQKYGFKFSRLEAEYCSQMTGVKSDLYLPTLLYNDVIYPFLNKASWKAAYGDKNMFQRILDVKNVQKEFDVSLPKCVACCANGLYFLDYDISCTRNEALDAVLAFGEDVIVKPTVNTSHGKGVIKISASDLSREKMLEVFDSYGNNFVVQKVIRQHPGLAAFNPTSVNTLRVTTYRDFKGNIKVLYASQRFGGKGKIFDNADDPFGSGGFCPVRPDGTVIREVHHYRNMEKTPLTDDAPEKIPFFEKMLEATRVLHGRMPQFAILGWDMTVDEDGHPIVIEYNFWPGLGTSQLAHGPFFSKEDLDEIMEKVSNCDMKPVMKLNVRFKDKTENNTILGIM